VSIVYPEKSFAVMGACLEACREKGYEFLEAVCQQCLEIEFGYRHIPCKPRPSLPITYKGGPLKIRYTPDSDSDSGVYRIQSGAGWAWRPTPTGRRFGDQGINYCRPVGAGLLAGALCESARMVHAVRSVAAFQCLNHRYSGLHLLRQDHCRIEGSLGAHG
jgi:hypothetical protein